MLLAIFMFLQPIQAVDQAAVEERYGWACPAEQRAEVSARLEELFEEDQADRRNRNFDNIIANDLARRKEVAAIFAEGCLTTGRDLYAAALIYQHGSVPAHYYQAYLWAAKAEALGDERSDSLIPLTVDRYLVALGYKQLFGTQTACGSPDENGMQQCCLTQTEKAFPDELRVSFGKPTFEGAMERSRGFASAPNREHTGMCEAELITPPKGVFPGIW